jgi:hypothetical protein
MAAAKKVKARLLARMSVIIPRMVIPDELREGLGGGRRLSSGSLIFFCFPWPLAGLLFSNS